MKCFLKAPQVFWWAARSRYHWAQVWGLIRLVFMVLECKRYFKHLIRIGYVVFLKNWPLSSSLQRNWLHESWSGLGLRAATPKMAKRVSWFISHMSVFTISYKILHVRGSSISNQVKGSTICASAWTSASITSLKSWSPLHKLHPLPKILHIASPPYPLFFPHELPLSVSPIVIHDWELLEGRALT